LHYDDLADALRITKVTDPFGRYAVLEYNDDGLLEKITDVIGIESSFEYEGNFIKTMTTPYGSTHFSFGANGIDRWLETVYPNGDKDRTEYRNYQTVVTADPLYPTEIPYAALSNGYVTHRNTFYWDRKAYKEAPGDFAKARVFHWAHQYDATTATSRSLESMKDPFSSRIWFQYPGTTGSVDGYSSQPIKVARIVDGPVSGTTTQLFQYAYNSKGRITQSTDPAGRVTNTVYAGNGLDIVEINRQVASGTEKLFSATYNSQHQPLTTADAAGQTTTMTYNPRGQVLTITNAKSEVTTFTYDTDGYLINVDGPLSGTGDSLTVTYDGFGRIATLTDGEGYELALDYDAMDRPTLVTFPDNTTEQTVYTRLDVAAVKDRAGKITRLWHNSFRQLVAQMDPLGRMTSFAYCRCGDVRSITDAMGRITRWTNDVQGRKTSKIYPDGRTEIYTYDLSSRLSSITDALGQVKTFRYQVDDALDTISYSNEVHPTSNVAYTWDVYYPRLITRVDGGGTTTFSYHPISSTPDVGAGRLASVDGPLANDTVTYEYDELGRMVERSINGSANEASVIYDAAGRITDITNVLGNFDLSYVGSTGRLDTVTTPNGLVTTFDYFGNAQDRRLKTLTYTGPSSTAISEFEYAYDVTGQITQWTQAQVANALHPELIWDIEQDAADQLTGVVIREGGTILTRESNAYDRAGNRLSAQINNAVKAGTFNNLNQLTTLAGGGKLRFVGTTDEPADVKVQGQNALMQSATNFTGYAEVTVGTNNIPVVATDGSGNNRTNTYQVVVPSGASRSFTYDFNGNLLDDGEREYEWDAENRMIKITQGGDVYEFAYDGMGRKISETVNSTLTRRWVWDGLEMAEERDASNVVTKRFFGQGEQHVGTSSPNDKLYYTRDHLGSIREVADSAGAVASAFSYSTWGKRTTLSGSILPSFGYTGHWNHSATGLVSAPFRFYDPETGRWQSRDPLEDAEMLEGPNLYAYVDNDPINYWDTDGRGKSGGKGGFVNINMGGVTVNTRMGVDGPPRGGNHPAWMKDFRDRQVQNIGKESNWGNPKTLQDHFDRHGKDFGSSCPGDYAKQAAAFFQKAQTEKLPTKISSDGVIRAYDPKSNTFGSYNSDGTTKTFFKPSSPAYWGKQPGDLQ